MERLLHAAAMLYCAFLASGCVSGTALPDLSGPWQTSVTSSTAGVTPVIIEANLAETKLDDNDGSISSTAFVVVNSCVSSDANSKVSGSVNVALGMYQFTGVDLSAIYAGVTTSLTGMVSGATMSGDYLANGACGNDVGKWTATKMPHISGNYSGNMFSRSNSTQPISVTVTITADSSLKITGQASISSVCFNQFSISGMQIGGAAQFVGTDPQDDSILFLFVANDATFASIQGSYSVTAGPSSCAGDSGTGSLTKM